MRKHLPSPFLPKDFILGTATSAHQVEGNNDNDWTRWEAAGKTREPSGRACNSWELYEQDFDLCASLGMDAHRMSVEWSRIEPAEGRCDEAALRRYRAMVDALRSRGIQPWITLQHFTLPHWLAARGGFAARDAPERFHAFARQVGLALGDVPAAYMTINEPTALLVMGYLDGRWPPGLRDPLALFQAAVGLFECHAAGLAGLREAGVTRPVGLVHNMIVFAPDRPRSPLDRSAAALADRMLNRGVIQTLKTGRLAMRIPGVVWRSARVPAARCDFLGVNYYTRIHLRGATPIFKDQGRGQSDLGWEIYPEGMERVLAQAAELGVPLYVTENGLDDREGRRRPAYLRDHLLAVRRAMDRGLDVRGYMHWSLLDNFEWAEGFAPRFGLFRVDYQTLARAPTPAAEEYRRIGTTRRIGS